MRGIDAPDDPASEENRGDGEVAWTWDEEGWMYGQWEVIDQQWEFCWMESWFWLWVGIYWFGL